MRKHAKSLKLLARRKSSRIIFILLFAAIGLVYLHESLATTPAASVEAEAGTLTANAALVSDASASGGAAVKFGTAASGSGGGICTNYIGSATDRNTVPIPGTNGQMSVRNEAWNSTHGPQTIYACSEQSWYVLSNQTDHAGAVQTYPDSLYSISGSKTIAQYTSITSTFSEQYQYQGDWNAAYDNWMNNFSKEVMIWNEWNGGPGYWATQAVTAVSLGGVPYHFYNNGGELMFFRDTQVKSGSVDILAAYKWLVTQGLLKSTDVPTQIEYGVEICSTVGTQRFDTTGFTVSLN